MRGCPVAFGTFFVVGGPAARAGSSPPPGPAVTAVFWVFYTSVRNACAGATWRQNRAHCWSRPPTLPCVWSWGRGCAGKSAQFGERVSCVLGDCRYNTFATCNASAGNVSLRSTAECFRGAFDRTRRERYIRLWWVGNDILFPPLRVKGVFVVPHEHGDCSLTIWVWRKWHLAGEPLPAALLPRRRFSSAVTAPLPDGRRKFSWGGWGRRASLLKVGSDRN